MNNQVQKIEELKMRYKKQLTAIEKIADTNNPLRVKAKFISCKHCESRLAKNYVKRTGYLVKCPLCGTSMFSITAQERMDQAQKKADEIKLHLNNLIENSQKNISQNTQQDAVNEIYDILDVIYEKHITPDFIEFRGNTGGDLRTLRAYKNGTICEK